MTREEIIEALNGIHAVSTGSDEFYINNYRMGDFNRLLRETMDLLKAQEPCADCISREDAIQAVRHAWAKGLEPSQYIELVPSVTPKAQPPRLLTAEDFDDNPDVDGEGYLP